MIPPDLNFHEFLKKLEGMDRAEIIRRASQESDRAKATKEKRGRKAEVHAYNTNLREYISDLGDFLYFVRSGHNAGMSWPEAFLASPEWKNIQRARYGTLLDDD